ncbi:oligosaccharide flippase family protein [Streptomyces sp. NPDC050738]|uniref:oligosaccharide flippase family protein n=1 Tax=Streptomyces sp. NPDC050738 TaxID=3154744 RepID=UPI00342854FD
MTVTAGTAAPRHTVLHGLTWNYAGSAAAMAVQLGCTAITARLLDPAAFGAYAAASSVTVLLGYLANSGPATCVLRAERLTAPLLRSTLALAALAGLACCLAAQLAVPVLNSLWNSPQTAGMLQILALQFLVQPAALVAVAALRRAGLPGAAVRAELGGQIGGSALGLSLLLAGWTPYAIAAVLPLGAALTALAAARPLRRAQLPPGEGVSTRELLATSTFFTGYGLVQSATNNAPLWLAATTLGATATGHYSRAALLTGIPLTVLAQGLNRAVTPTLAAARVPPQAVYDVLCAASAAGLIGLGALAGAGPALLLLLLGPAWTQAAQLVPVLAAGAACAMLCSTGNSVDTVRKDTGALLRTQLTAIAAAAATLAAAWTRADLALIAAATLTAPLAGHALQLAHWHRTRTVAVGRLLGAHAVHAALGTALAVVARLATHGRLTSAAALLISVGALCTHFRDHVPLLAMARTRRARPGAPTGTHSHPHPHP